MEEDNAASDFNAETIDLLTKCGEVFLQSREQESFIFFCTLCDEKCLRLDIFTNHIKYSHLIEENIKQEESEPELENSLSISIISNDAFKQQPNEEPAQSSQLEEEFLLTDESYEEKPDISALSQKTSQVQYFLNANHTDEESQSPPVYLPHCPKLKKETKHFKCAKCAKCFKRKSSMKAHELTHESIKPYACDQCGHTFASKQNLVIHVRRHVGEKPFKCTYCEKTFVSSTERYSHERLHTGSRPFLCEECGKGHSTSSQLSEHRRRHAGDRRFECTDCDKRFLTGWHMRTHHSLVHANLPRNHCCSDCGAGFKTSRDLKQHEKIHAKVKMYKCRFCSKEFSQHPGLYAHMKTH